MANTDTTDATDTDFVSPPGPASFKARLAVARAGVADGAAFAFRVARKNTDATGPLTLPYLVLNSVPNGPLIGEMEGRTFWGEGNAPSVIRLECKGEVPVELRPLLFTVRRGQEWDDFIALVRRIQRGGEKYDAPVHEIWPYESGYGRGQFVAHLDKASAVDEANESEAPTNE